MSIQKQFVMLLTKCSKFIVGRMHASELKTLLRGGLHVLVCHSCRKFWIDENFKSDSSAYNEVSSMAKSLFKEPVIAQVKKEAQVQDFQKLFISYAEKFRYNQVRETLQEKFYKNFHKLERGYQNIKAAYEEKKETMGKKLNELEDKYGATKKLVKSLRSKCRFLEQKRKMTVEIANKMSRIIGAAWKNNILDCFEGVMKYWTFHGKRHHRDNPLKQYLGSLRSPPGAQYNYISRFLCRLYSFILSRAEIRERS